MAEMAEMEELQGQQRLTSHKSRVVQVLREIAVAVEDAAAQLRQQTHTSTSNWQQAHTFIHGRNGPHHSIPLPSNICCQHRLYISAEDTATNTCKPVV
uniref:GG12457 n=1 Tax=Drosophila erecta TaxID=7220 RepID=B3P7F7_DROER